MRRAIILLVLLSSCISATGASRTLARAELAKIRAICQHILGSRPDEMRWRVLTPYVRTPDAIDKLVIPCSASCDASIPLKSGYEVHLSWPNTPRGWPGAGKDRIELVQLAKGDKIMFTLVRHNKT